MTPGQRDLRDALASVPARIAAAAASIDDPAAPASGEWSPREVTLHLAAVEAEVWQPRLEAFRTESYPHWPWVEPGQWAGPGGETFAGGLAAFDELRAATVARLDALDDAGWSRRGRHATFGELDVAGLMRVALDHDEEHLAQIAR